MRFKKFPQSNLRKCLLYSFPKQSDLVITEGGNCYSEGGNYYHEGVTTIKKRVTTSRTRGKRSDWNNEKAEQIADIRARASDSE